VKRRSWSRIADRQRGAGMSVGEITGRNLKKCVLAPGGSDPFIVFDSVNMTRPSPPPRSGGWRTPARAASRPSASLSWRTCTRSSSPGPPAHPPRCAPETRPTPPPRWGPSLPERTADLSGQVRDAVDKGATVVTGGGRPEHQEPSSTRPCSRVSDRACALTPSSCSARWRPYTASPAMTRLWSSRT